MPRAALGGPDDGGVHQLQDWPLAERIRDDLRAALLLQEEPFEQGSGAHDAPVPEREAQVGDTRVEVVPEARPAALAAPPPSSAALNGPEISGILFV
jgi:hypothetical protein